MHRTSICLLDWFCKQYIFAYTLGYESFIDAYGYMWLCEDISHRTKLTGSEGEEGIH